MSEKDEKPEFERLALRSLADVACDSAASAPARVKAAQAMLSYLLALAHGPGKVAPSAPKTRQAERSPAELADELAELRKTRANQAIQALK